MCEYTKGPWSWSAKEADVVAGEAHICVVSYAGFSPDAEARANARLIAAAPSMYAELEHCAKILDTGPTIEPWARELIHRIRVTLRDAKEAQ